jgi:hypothetical protein
MSDDSLTDDEIALRAAINVLRDTLESRRMLSGLPLEPDAAKLHCTDHSHRQQQVGVFEGCTSRPAGRIHSKDRQRA